MSRQLAQRQRRLREALNARERESVNAQLIRERERDREMMAQFIEAFAPEPELVPFPGSQLDLVPTPMPFVPEAPPNG